MHTANRTKLVAPSSCMKWRGTLSTSVAFLLAALQPMRHLKVKQQSQVCETDRVASRLACPGVMLVESDVCQHSFGIVP